MIEYKKNNIRKDRKRKWLKIDNGKIEEKMKDRKTQITWENRKRKKIEGKQRITWRKIERKKR